MTLCKALSVRNPWAALIRSGHKTIELRNWTTKHRGPLLICSSGRVWKGEREPLFAATDVEVATGAPCGVAMVVVELLDVRPATAGDAQAAGVMPEPGEFAWVFGERRHVEHVPVVGRLKLFDVDLDDLFSSAAASR